MLKEKKKQCDMFSNIKYINMYAISLLLYNFLLNIYQA